MLKQTLQKSRIIVILGVKCSLEFKYMALILLFKPVRTTIEYDNTTEQIKQ